MQPGRKAGLSPEAFEPGKNPQENLLGQIGRVGLTHETKGECVNLAVKAVIKRSLGDTVPMLAKRQ